MADTTANDGQNDDQNNNEAAQIGLRRVAKSNMKRNAKLAKLRMQKEHGIAVASLRHDASGWAKNVPSSQRQDRDVLLAAIQSDHPMRFRQYIDGTNWDVKDPPFIPRAMMDDRDIILALVELEDFFWSTGDVSSLIPDEMKADREIMTAICKKSPHALASASGPLKDDKELVLSVVKSDPSCLRHASDTLRDDKEIILAMLGEKNSCAVAPFCASVRKDSKLRDDRDVAMALLECRPSWEFRDVLLEFSENIRGDKEVIQLAVSIDGHMLEDASTELKADKEVVMVACQTTGCALQHASEELRADKEVVQTACWKDGEALVFVGNSIYDECATDAEFMEKVIKSGGGRMLVCGPKSIQEDEDMVLAALRNQMSFSNVPSYQMRSDREFIIKAITASPTSYNELRRRQRQEKDIVRAALLAGYGADTGGIYIDDMYEEHSDLFTERDVFLRMVKDGNDEYYESEGPSLSEELRDDKEFMLQICSHDGDLLSIGTSRIKEDKEVVEAAVGDTPSAFTCLSDRFQLANPDLVIKFIEEKGENIEVCSELLSSNRKVALSYAKHHSSASLDDELENYDDDVEIVLAKVGKDYSELRHADDLLLEDDEFCLSAVRVAGLSVKHMPVTLQHHFNIHVAATCDDIRVVDYLIERNEEEELLKFAAAVREKLSLHESFTKDIICSIDIPPDRDNNDDGEDDDDMTITSRNLESDADGDAKEDEVAEGGKAFKKSRGSISGLVQDTTSLIGRASQSSMIVTGTVGAVIGVLSLSQGSSSMGDNQLISGAASLASVALGSLAGLKLVSNQLSKATATGRGAVAGPTSTSRNLSIKDSRYDDDDDDDESYQEDEDDDDEDEDEERGCHLHLLGMGTETSSALKQLLADFLGVPRGNELRELRAASYHLAIRGY